MDRAPPTLFQSRFSMPDNISQLMDLEGGCRLASTVSSWRSHVHVRHCTLETKSRVQKVFAGAFVVLCSSCVVQQRHLMS